LSEAKIDCFSLGWVDYFANVGGLLGLCIGLSIVTIMELVWLGMRLANAAISRFSNQPFSVNEIAKEAWK